MFDLGFRLFWIPYVWVWVTESNYRLTLECLIAWMKVFENEKLDQSMMTNSLFIDVFCTSCELEFVLSALQINTKSNFTFKIVIGICKCKWMKNISSNSINLLSITTLFAPNFVSSIYNFSKRWKQLSSIS